MKTIKGRHYRGEIVPVDGYVFVDCIFEDSVLVVSGKPPPGGGNAVGFDGKTTIAGDTRCRLVGAAKRTMVALDCLVALGVAPTLDALCDASLSGADREPGAN